MKVLVWILLPLICAFATEEAKSLLEKEVEIVDFKKIREVLKNDMLDTAAAEKTKAAEVQKQQREQSALAKYNIPEERAFWEFFTEYWLVKNAPLIKWDFEKPDYGLDESFKEFLEKMGHFEKPFKILLVNTPNLFHAALPTNRGESLFLLSVPFIRTLDLSKLEISLLLFENYLRDRMEYFKKYVTSKELEAVLGGNFKEKKKLDVNVFESVSKKYDELLYDKGFNFQQQFEITKQMEKLLKQDMKLWSAYIQLLQKIDRMTKENLLYSKYSKIYPSPELQLSWIVPAPKRP